MCVIYFSIFFVGPSGPQTFGAVRITEMCCSMQPAVLWKLWGCSSSQHCQSAASPGHLGGIKEQEQQQFQGLLVLYRLVLPPGFQGMR